MKCDYCGAPIPDGQLFCDVCGYEVQIVPDYSPLEDVLTKQVKGSIESATKQMNLSDTVVIDRTSSIPRETGYQGRIYQTGETPVPRRKETTKRTGAIPRETKQEQEERRRRERAKKKQLAKKRRQRRFIILAGILLVCGILGFLIYQNSYEGQVRKGNRALAAKEYTAAERYFAKAMSKDEKKAGAYTGLSQVYIDQDDLDAAEEVFLTAIDQQPSNAAIYRAAVDFYISTEQMTKISELLDDCDEDTVLSALDDYISEPPLFSLDEGTYDEVQQLSLDSDGVTIYYTTDGSEPTISSTKYTEPILLNEGETVVKAISVNKKDVPSLSDTKTYVVEIPIADAPAVTPSTGQYDTPTQISIHVPAGYEAYYTLDGSDPTAASARYTGPIDMPEGQTIFCAVLIMSGQDRATQITKRNYILSYE